jgi:uncharacterized protein (TIGR02266 family)
MRRINVRMLWATCAAIGIVAASTMIALDLTASGPNTFYDQTTGEIDLLWTLGAFGGWFLSTFVGSSALVFTVARLVGMGTERRKRPERRRLAVKVDLETEPRPQTGLTQDISEGGLFVATDHPRQVGDRLALRFRLPGQNQALSVETEVRWIRGSSSAQPDSTGGMGLRFVNLSPLDKATIRGFLAKSDGPGTQEHETEDESEDPESAATAVRPESGKAGA